MKPSKITCRQAAEVVEQLQKWIEDRDGLSTTPIAHLIWSTSDLEINIGAVTVWCSDEDDESDMTFEFCRKRFLDDMRNILPFIQQP